jgi:putative lipoprotein
VRRIHGLVEMPPDAPSATALVRVELRDVTYADDKSVVVAEAVSRDAVIGPGRRHAFELEAPESTSSTSLSLRCHVDLAGHGVVTPGDLVSNQSLPVPPVGDAGPLIVPVELV